MEILITADFPTAGAFPIWLALARPLTAEDQLVPLRLHDPPAPFGGKLQRVALHLLAIVGSLLGGLAHGKLLSVSLETNEFSDFISEEKPNVLTYSILRS